MPPAPSPTPDSSFEAWREPLLSLLDGIRRRTLEHQVGALASRDGAAARPVAQGVGDLTFALDLPSERWIERWFRERAREGPLSVLTEDSGWRHLGPAPAHDGGDPADPGEPLELSGFDHGGPRIAFDPVDGTRNLMADLRSAWTVVSFAPAGAHMPRLADLTAGIVSELPTSAAARHRTYLAEVGADCLCLERERASGRELGRRTVRVDADDRADHGYFPFFRYDPPQRPALATLEADFFARLERFEAADLRSVFDDQYISSAGQLVLLMEGTYRSVVDARAWMAERLGTPAVTSKPYDLAGAVVCARAAGAVLRSADDGELDFPIDATTPVHMAGFANAATHARLAPHLVAALGTVS